MQSDVFFITYDEPSGDQLWAHLQQIVPGAKRVHGVKGFDAAYKACAAQASTDRFFTVDGDNEIYPALASLILDPALYSSSSVLSWSARNSVNGLCYGNGGVKNWPREVALKMRTHESSDQANANSSVDFCFQLNYFQMPETLSEARVNDTPYQAFRAGFREGVKMCLERGERPLSATELKNHVASENLNRLRIWCSVGADAPRGKWAMLGARLGCKMLCLEKWNHALIRDYEWFARFWRESIEHIRIDEALASLELELNGKLGLGVTTMSEEGSRFFKSVYVNPPRNGLMFK